MDPGAAPVKLASAGEKSWEIKGWVEHLLEEHRLQDDSNEGKKEAMNSRFLLTIVECNLHLQRIDMEPEHELFL